LQVRTRVRILPARAIRCDQRQPRGFYSAATVGWERPDRQPRLRDRLAQSLGRQQFQEDVCRLVRVGDENPALSHCVGNMPYIYTCMFVETI
jgi:hypothetical protein